MEQTACHELVSVDSVGALWVVYESRAEDETAPEGRRVRHCEAATSWKPLYCWKCGAELLSDGTTRRRVTVAAPEKIRALPIYELLSKQGERDTKWWGGELLERLGLMRYCQSEWQLTSAGQTVLAGLCLAGGEEAPSWPPESVKETLLWQGFAACSSDAPRDVAIRAAIGAMHSLKLITAGLKLTPEGTAVLAALAAAGKEPEWRGVAGWLAQKLATFHRRRHQELAKRFPMRPPEIVATVQPESKAEYWLRRAMQAAGGGLDGTSEQFADLAKGDGEGGTDATG